MKLAQRRHPCYNFTTQLTTWGKRIVSICKVSQEPALGFYWRMYIDPGRTPSQYGIDDLIPRHGQCIVFLYEQGDC